MASDRTQARDAFSPDAVVAINRAYERAVEQMGITTAHSERRADLARYIMDLAKAGETDEQRLRDQAIAAVNRMGWIKARAHRIWETEGQQGENHEDHWRRAEQDYESEKAADQQRSGKAAQDRCA